MQHKGTQTFVVFIDSDNRISLLIYLKVMALTSSCNCNFHRNKSTYIGKNFRSIL